LSALQTSNVLKGASRKKTSRKIVYFINFFLNLSYNLTMCVCMS